MVESAGHYVYDAAGNIASRQVETPGAASVMTPYSHNSLNQITALQRAVHRLLRNVWIQPQRRLRNGSDENIHPTTTEAGFSRHVHEITRVHGFVNTAGFVNAYHRIGTP